jgi:hypothetical protein
MSDNGGTRPRRRVPPGAYCRGGRGEACGRNQFTNNASTWWIVRRDDGDQYWCDECWLKRDPADREPGAEQWVTADDW